MRSILVGVAGHVDHGKTTLVKSLTGIDTDRLPEEKKRGMSIDIGFSFLDFPDVRVEIIDVPGHEKFIRNAIAGISTVKGLLLVVDAREGVMPQTIEHLKLAKCYGINRILVAITKVDLVDEETLLLAKEEVLEVLKDLGLEALSVCFVSSTEGKGLYELKIHIRDYALSLYEDRKDHFLRVVLDSAFLVKGYGTVVRGSCVSGKLQEGEKLLVEPIGTSVRARKIQTHGAFTKEVVGGQRVAINIPELNPEGIERGFWIVREGELLKSNALILRTDIKPGRIYEFFFGMRPVLGVGKRIQEDTFLVKLNQYVVSIAGDMGPVLSTEGKLVANYQVVHPLPRRKSKIFIKANLETLFNSLHDYMLLEWSKDGVELRMLGSALGKPVNPMHLRALRVGNKLFHPEVVKETTDKLLKVLKEMGGTLKVSQAKSMLKVDEVLFRKILSENQILKVVDEFIIHKSYGKIEELETFKKLMDLLEEGIKEERELSDFREILPLCVRKGYIHSLGDHLYISDKLLKEYVNSLKELGGSFDIQTAKAKIRLSRKYLIPLLEYMDRLGITRREGDRRMFLK